MKRGDRGIRHKKVRKYLKAQAKCFQAGYGNDGAHFVSTYKNLQKTVWDLAVQDVTFYIQRKSDRSLYACLAKFPAMEEVFLFTSQSKLDSWRKIMSKWQNSLDLTPEWDTYSTDLSDLAEAIANRLEK